MLTKLIIKRFKRFSAIEVELGNPVVFIGPNNYGKTSALQALVLWETGLKRWFEKRANKQTPKKRSGVVINRKDLVAVPVPNTKLLWQGLHVRDIQQISGKQSTQNVRMEITVEGVSEGKTWKLGLEFDYANEESIYCRPLRNLHGNAIDPQTIPEDCKNLQIAFLPPMSGLTSNETRLDAGAINVRVGEGRTAEVLRNLCHKVHQERPELWEKLKNNIEKLFGAQLNPPRYVTERGEIEMDYVEKGLSLDLSSSGRGLQQTLLLLSYMYANPGAVLLLDEPDAHLEILRQRQIYELLTNEAQENNNQIIAASHSEILLNEAAERDVVIAFLGTPHRINDRGSQLLKSLREIGWEQYYQAEQNGWVLYLEGSTDLAILKSFAKILNNTNAIQVLNRPFVRYVGDQPNEVRKHFHGIKYAFPDLLGIAIFDRLEMPLPADLGAKGLTWKKREIESYLCSPEALMAFAELEARNFVKEPLFQQGEIQHRQKIMQESIDEIKTALSILGKGSPWDGNMKVSDDFLTPLFEKYYAKLGLPNLMNKTNFHRLAECLNVDFIVPEIEEKLKDIVKIAHKAKPLIEE